MRDLILEYVNKVNYQPKTFEELVLELAQKDSEINVLNTKVAEIEEQANLNLTKAQEIVNELKEIINA